MDGGHHPRKAAHSTPSLRIRARKVCGLISSNLRSLTVGQSWIDERYLWLDLLDGEGVRYEARLRANFRPRRGGLPAVGTLVRDGRTYRVRCEES